MGFQAVYGHKKQIEILVKVLTGDKIPHAYLFTGIGGIGKKLVALKLAQALQCRLSDDGPCDHCVPCRKIIEGNHPDVMLLQPEEKYIKIEQVRELKKKLGFKPFEGNKSVCIIDGADKMNVAAANSLLKTLEEPPAETHLILLAENVRSVVPTIISRCQKLKFNPLSSSDIEKILIDEKNFSREEVHAATLIAEGSPGKAITFTKTFPREERDKLVAAFAGIGRVEEAFSLAETLTKKEQVEKLMESLEILKFYLRDIVVMKLKVKRDQIINKDQLKSIEDKATRHTLEELLNMVDAVTKTEAALAMNSNKRLSIENLFIQLIHERKVLCQR